MACLAYGRRVLAIAWITTACSAGDEGTSRTFPAASGGGAGLGMGGSTSSGGVTGLGGMNTGDVSPAPTGGASASAAGGAIFEWPEGETATGPCLPGKYVGTFECIFNDPTNPLIPKDLKVTGPVAFNLTESTRGEFLEIADGTIDGAALAFIQFTGPLEGDLDCASKKFEAKVTNGNSFAGPFTGDMQGTLDPGTQTLAGEWSLKASSLPDGACVGPWSVVRQP